MKLLKRYSIALAALLLFGLLFFYNRDLGQEASGTILMSLKEMATILPPVFILLGLLDVWVPRETMVKYMGEDSGVMGAVLAFVLGSAAAGPLYVSFPVAAALMKKDVKFFNVLIMVGAWSSAKIPMLIFEYSSLGPRFMLTRLALSILIVIIIALVLNSVMKDDEVREIYRKVREME